MVGRTNRTDAEVLRLPLAAAALAGLAAIVAALAGFGTRWGFWTHRTGFDILEWAVYGGIVAFLVAVLAIFSVRRTRDGRALTIGLAALIVAAIVIGVPWRWQRIARGVPPIHDITTDTRNPPEFVAIAPLREGAPNPIEYGGPEVAAQQAKAYPEIRPVVLGVAADQAYQRALETALDMRWEIVETRPEEGRIEATDETFWFGFKDDIVIRLTPSGARTVVDVRSVSRVGRGDAGTNARRIRKFLSELQER